MSLYEERVAEALYEERVAEAMRLVMGSGGPRPKSAFGNSGRELLMKKIAEEIAITPSPRAWPQQETNFNAMARGLLSGNGPISRHVRFAQSLISFRHEILAELINLYGGQGKVLLFTPALIDLSGWLDDKQQSDLESQIRLMEQMQRMN